MNKVSNSNNEDSNSENKPRFYRREFSDPEAKLKFKDSKEYKRIGNNFRIVRSPGRNEGYKDKTTNIVKVNNPNTNAVATNKPKRAMQQKFVGLPRQLPNMQFSNNAVASRNVNFNRNSQLQFKAITGEQIDPDEIIAKNTFISSSGNLGQIKEENKENNGSRTSMRMDSTDPRQKSTPRVKEHFDNQESEENAEEFKFCRYNNFMNFDSDVIQKISLIYQIPIDEIFLKLQAYDEEMMELYEKQSQASK